jgi:hypothetical protein
VTHGSHRNTARSPYEWDAEDGWTALFPPGTPLAALPDWRRPRVVIPADTPLRRWRGSGFYPAFRPAARVYRLLLRLRAGSGIGPVRLTTDSPGTGLTNLVDEVMPGATVGAVMIGMPGAARTIVAQLTDPRGNIVAYLKWADSVPARRTLRHEYRLLRSLPQGTGPVALSYEARGFFETLLLAPVSGTRLPATLPPPRGLSAFTASLATTTSVDFARHPWVTGISHWRGRAVESSFATLSGRDWPIVIQHGDLAPWNVFRTSGGGLAAVDWEYGRSDGFPGLDLAHYVLQVACLCQRWSPKDSRAYASRYLERHSRLRLSPAEAEAVVTLSAYNVYQLAVEDGHGLDDPTQRWRRAIWEVTE